MAFIRSISSAFTAAILSQEVSAADWPNADNIHDISGGSTPVNTVTVITADQPYNADQNTMDFSYHIEQRNDKTYFYMTMKSKIEIGTAGT